MKNKEINDFFIKKIKKLKKKRQNINKTNHKAQLNNDVTSPTQG